jgi:serine protease Do
MAIATRVPDTPIGLSASRFTQTFMRPVIRSARGRARVGLLLAVSLALAACGGNGGDGAAGEVVGRGPASSATARTANAQTPPVSPFQRAADAALPSTVFILVEARPRQSMFPMGPFAPQASGGQQAPLMPLGSGSGVIFREGGYILTNNHVVQDAARVLVTLYDRRQFDAQVVARDPSTDIAVVKIEGENLPVATLGNSDSLHLGQWVEALGNPLGVLRFTVTAGIIGATGRQIGILATNGAVRAGEASPLEDYLQTDAAINPGNSGGPLVDLSGRVIGINSAIASTTGAFTGYGFAIPINLARRVADELIKYGQVRRPFLGVALKDVNPVDAKAFDLPSVDGAEVVHVERGSPAEHAELALGDVIVAVGDRAVHTVSELQAALAALDPGTTVQLHVIRYGDRLTIPVKLGLVTSGVKPQPPPSIRNEQARAGFAVVERGGHVVVAAVRTHSAAARAGVRPGQEILEANRQRIASIDQLASVIRKANGGPLSLIVDDPDLGRTIITYQLEP